MKTEEIKINLTTVRNALELACQLRELIRPAPEGCEELDLAYESAAHAAAQLSALLKKTESEAMAAALAGKAK